MTELPDIAMQSGERQTLMEFLNYQRAVLIRKTEGLDDFQARVALPPSDLTLGGLLKHMAYVESHWASYIVSGNDPVAPWADAPWDEDADWEMSSAADDALTDIQDLFRSSVAAADVVYNDLELDSVAARWAGGDAPPSIRWVLVHMIEEYARHLGHADFLRQSIDGATGD